MDDFMRKNNKNIKKHFIVAVALLILFVGYTVCVCTVEVRPVGIAGSDVGFASLNMLVASKLPFNSTLYAVTDILGYLCIASAGIFAGVGFIQLLRRKGFQYVDANLYVLAGLYGVSLAFYLFFDKIAINYRPVIIDADEILDPSYPSSHTLMSFTFITGAIIQLPIYIKNKGLRFVLYSVCALIIFTVVGGRTLSGAHWITDIVGSVFLGTALTELAVAFTMLFEKQPSVRA